MGRRIKVLRVVIGLNLGGVQQGVLNLCRQLDPERYEIMVCALENDGVVGREIAQAGFEVVVLGLKGKSARPRIVYELYRLMKSRRIDLVHGSAYHPGLYARLAGILARVPILINHEHVLSHRRIPHRALISHWLGKRTQAHIAVSQAVKDQVVSWYDLNPDKVRVIYNGVRPEFFQAARWRAASRERLGLAPDTRVVGVVSRLHLDKGFGVLIPALEALKAQFPLKLLVVGTGPHEERIRGLVRDHHLEGVVEFLGYRRDTPELLAAMDVFVLPSTKEGFPNALLEAMAAGLPVVVSDHAPHLEAVEAGSSGLVFPQNDREGLCRCLREILLSPDQAKHLGEAARRRVAAHFTLERFGRGVQALYDELASQRLAPS
jgi:glycosyltransferase involved in cell wall biosynthesis